MKSNKPAKFALLGLPKYGTTIICNFFNSLENGVCLSEPIWLKMSRNRVSNGKLSNYDLCGGGDLLDNVLKFGSHGYDFVGLKETYRITKDKWDQYEPSRRLLESDKLDFIVFILRDPLVGFSSWKNTGWGGEYNDVNCYLDTLGSFIRDYSSYDNKKYVFSYEKFCNKPLEYTNAIFSGNYTITTHSDIIQLDKVNNEYGDPRANRSAKITPARVMYNNLTKNEIDKIKSSQEYLYIIDELNI